MGWLDFVFPRNGENNNSDALKEFASLSRKYYEILSIISQKSVIVNSWEDLIYNKDLDIWDKTKIINLKKEFKSTQCEALNESIRHFMQIIMPVELNLFVNK